MEPVSGKVTSKGQITLPAKVRKRLGVKPGDRIDFVESDSGNVEIVARRKTLTDLRGIVPYEGPSLSDADVTKLVDDARSTRARAAAKRARNARR